MSLDFKSGNYSVQTGKTFSNSDDPTYGYYAFRFTSKLDPAMTSRTASLRQENDTYFADWALADNTLDNTLSYEGVKGNIQEQECLLIFDEETQTFTIERPVLKTTLKKRKKKATESTNKKQKAKAKPTPSSSTSKTKSKGDTAQQQQTSPISLALPPQQKRKDTQGAVNSPLNDNSDSFDDDILRDMDEILNSNNDDDDDDGEDDDNDEFETVAANPTQVGNALLSDSPRPIAVSSPGSQQQSSTTGNRRHQALKMASAPIRRLDSSPPTPAPTTSSSSAIIPPSAPAPQSPSLSNNRPRTGGKTISAETLAARRKAASAIRSDSSSESSSSGSDSSSDDGSGSSGSSGSDSDDDDDDEIDALAANISRGLSEDEARHPSPYAPHSRQDGTTPNYIRHTPNPATPSNLGSSSNTPGGPTSLRDLLGTGDQREDEDVSSSDSSDDDG